MSCKYKYRNIYDKNYKYRNTCRYKMTSNIDTNTNTRAMFNLFKVSMYSMLHYNYFHSGCGARIRSWQVYEGLNASADRVPFAFCIYGLKCCLQKSYAHRGFEFDRSGLIGMNPRLAASNETFTSYKSLSLFSSLVPRPGSAMFWVESDHRGRARSKGQLLKKAKSFH